MNPDVIMNLINVNSDNMNVDIDQQDVAVDDLLLVRQVACGDEGAFSILYQRYHKQIFNYVLRLIHEQKEAEDLLQEIFLAVWRGASRYREQAAVKTWLYRIGHNQAVSWLRKHHEVSDIDDRKEINDISIEQISMDTWQRKEIHKALNNLSHKHRAVIELAFVHDMAYKEIAQVVGCPIGTVKSRMSYALKALYFMLKKTDR